MILQDPEAGPSGPENGLTRRVRYQPKCALFTTLVRLWILPSLGAIVVIVSAGNPWPAAGSWLDRFAQVRFEQWIGLGILAAHFLFGCLAIRYRRVESFHEEVIDLSESNQSPADSRSGTNIGR